MKDDRRTSIRVRFGTSALTSLMTLGLEPASNDSSFTLKIVFSFGLAATASSPAAAASSAPAPAPPAAGAAAAAGKAISWMFRRVYKNFHILRKRCWMRGCFLSYLEEGDEVCGLEQRQNGYVIYDFVQGWVGG